MKFARFFLLATLCLRVCFACAEETYRFPNGRSTGNVDFVTVQFKVGGDIVEMLEGKVNRVKMGAMADMEYMEKTLEASEGANAPARTIREYRRAEATIRVGEDALRPTLRPEVSLVVAAIDDQRSLLFSPETALSRDELELIDILGNSLLIDRLLPSSPLAVGQTWKPSRTLLAQLLGLDAVGQSDVQCELIEVTDSVGRFQMTGSLAGTVHGVATQIQLKSKYRYDRRSRRIDWFALSMKEVRAVALVAQGFDVVAQVQVRIVPKSSVPDAFAPERLEGLTLEPGKAAEALIYEPPGSDWQLAHNRQWFVTRDAPDLVELRLVGRGELVAQCSISPLPRVPVEKLPSLERFQEDVRRALGDRFERFVSAGQWANDAECRVYRVVVSGTAQAELKQTAAKVPIEWRYYLVVNQEGRRIVLAVTAEAELAERLGDADRELADAIRFTASSSAAENAK
jgi:hypothetical protein